MRFTPPPPVLGVRAPRPRLTTAAAFWLAFLCTLPVAPLLLVAAIARRALTG